MPAYRYKALVLGAALSFGWPVANSAENSAPASAAAPAGTSGAPETVQPVRSSLAPSSSGPSSPGPSRPQLAGHASPYLAGHASDPVAWRTWGAEAFAEARAGGRLLFVSSGYFSCHWCHVMQAETYRDEAAAALINAGTIPVKIDRELRPALDAHLIDFVETTTGRAGWPLNVLMTPDGHPLLGFTYLPRERFVALLRGVLERWHRERDSLTALAARADRQLRARHRQSPVSELTAAEVLTLRETLDETLMRAADLLAGGFGDGAKFPSTPQLRALLDAERRGPDPERHAFLALTFIQMATQGLRDQLAGGFFRYTTDPSWQVPHFEKMLYDNALLASLYQEAGTTLDMPLLTSVATDTVQFMLRELWDPRGAFRASLSAVDSEGREGHYYLISQTEMEAHLTPQQARVVALGWGLEGAEPFPSGYLARQVADSAEIARALALPRQAVADAIEAARRELLKVRDSRTLPVDDKLLAGWNGLALSALVHTGAASEGGIAHHQAAALAGYLGAELWNGAELARARVGGVAVGHASLQDHAYVAAGLFDWWLASGDPAMLDATAGIVRAAWADFHTEGGWRLAAQDLIVLAEERAAIPDRALPSPSATLLAVTLRLPPSHISRTLTDRARGAALRLQSGGPGSTFYLASHIQLAAETVLGRNGERRTRAAR